MIINWQSVGQIWLLDKIWILFRFFECPAPWVSVQKNKKVLTLNTNIVGDHGFTLRVEKLERMAQSHAFDNW